MRRNGVDRRVLFTNDDGTIERQFFLEGDEQPWGAEADRFVAEVMPIVLRETAIDADERVAWLIDNRGHDGLLDEIELIQSDFAQRVYTVQYAQTAEIAAADFERLMTMTADHMSSDFDLRTTLIEVFDAQMPTGADFVALLEAGETISSDFDTRTVLEHVGPNMPRTPEAAAAYSTWPARSRRISTCGSRCSRSTAPIRRRARRACARRRRHGHFARISTCARCSPKRPAAWAIGHVGARVYDGRRLDQQRFRSAPRADGAGRQRRADPRRAGSCCSNRRATSARISTPRRC